MNRPELLSFVALSLRTQTAQIRHQVNAGVTEFMLDIRGVPGVSLARVRAIPQSESETDIEILSVQGDPVEPPELIKGIRLLSELVVEDDSLIGRNGSRWVAASPGHVQEAIDIDDLGVVIYRSVSAAKKPWKLVCECGQLRYSTRGNVHKIDRCNLCAKRRRHDYQVAWQRTKRKSSSS